MGILLRIFSLLISSIPSPPFFFPQLMLKQSHWTQINRSLLIPFEKKNEKKRSVSVCVWCRRTKMRLKLKVKWMQKEKQRVCHDMTCRCYSDTSSGDCAHCRLSSDSLTLYISLKPMLWVIVLLHNRFCFRTQFWSSDLPQCQNGLL